MIAIRPNQNIRIFWRNICVFNLEYYYHMLSEYQRGLYGTRDIFKTLTHYQKKMITEDFNSTVLQFQPMVSSALARCFDTDVASIIYAYM
jgi:hypothetical protein